MNIPSKNHIFFSRNASAMFVYGTLRKSYGHPLHDYLSNHFNFIGEGFITGELYDIGHYPGIVISKKATGIVRGEVYQAKNKTIIYSILKILDDYEGYNEANEDDCEYVRKRKIVKLNNGKRCLCWLYEYNRPVSNKELIAGGDYIRYISKKPLHGLDC